MESSEPERIHLASTPHVRARSDPPEGRIHWNLPAVVTMASAAPPGAQVRLGVRPEARRRADEFHAFAFASVCQGGC